MVPRPSPRARSATGEVNNPAELPQRCSMLSKACKSSFNDGRQGREKKVSLADLIVLGGCVGIEEAARRARS